MSTGLTLSLMGGGLVLIYLLHRWTVREKVGDFSADWHRDHDRRLNGAGLDGVSWRWPVDKKRDQEQAGFNRYRLRKKA